MRLVDVYDLRSGMIVGLDIKSDDTIIIPKGTVLSTVDIEKVSNHVEISHDKVWVYDLMEIKPLLLKDTMVTKQYIDFIVTNFRDILHTAVTDLESCDNLVNSFQLYFTNHRDLLYEELLLRDNHCYTYEHSMNVALYSLLIGMKLGLTDKDLSSLLIGSILHDVGKVSISNALLDKPARLDEDEFKAIKQHPIYGVQRVNHLKCLSDDIIKIIEQHHEKLDGSGYPYGLTANNISLLAKIISVADIFDAVTSSRSYHSARPVEKGIAILYNDASTGKIDKDIVDALVSQLILYPLNSMVLLSNGVTGLVIESSKDNKPIVQGFEDNKIYNLKLDSSISVVRCL